MVYHNYLLLDNNFRLHLELAISRYYTIVAKKLHRQDICRLNSYIRLILLALFNSIKFNSTKKD